MKNRQNIENDEIDCLLEAIWRRYGYDFRHYSRASIKRRIRHHMGLSDCQHISEMIPKIFHDESFFESLLNDLSISVTQMFRDHVVFNNIRQQIFPKLKTYARINIWHAGCSTGEEAYTLAILLEEEGLLNRTQIYATDFNNASIDKASRGIYPLKSLQNCNELYLSCGGKHKISDYYHANYEAIKFKQSLVDHITFAHHNLTCDQVFAQMHLILCRNVLIYFDKTLQNHVLNLCRDSLVSQGFLVLGDKENLDFSSVREDFDNFSQPHRIYRKRAGW